MWEGKGPVDGLGGSIKRTVRRAVTARQSIVIVTNAEELVGAVQQSWVTVGLVKPEEIKCQKLFLDERWKNVKTLSDTQQAHDVVAASPATVECSRFPGAVKLFVHNFVSETNSEELHGFQCGNCSASNTANTEKKT